MATSPLDGESKAEDQATAGTAVGAARRAALDDALDAIRVASAEWGPNWEDAQSVLTEWRAELTTSNVRALADAGEAPTGKKCATCGVPRLVLVWRPADAGASSSLSEPAWFPTTPVREAKMQCAACKMLAYGLLVGGHKDDQGLVVGEFMLRDPRETVYW